MTQNGSEPQNDSEPPALTATQARRVAAVAAGLSAGEIARTEGVSTQAVAQSLDAPAVKRAIAWMRVGGMRLPMVVLHGGVEVSLVTTLLESLTTIALDATRPVVAGALVETVPDYELRAKVAMRLLDMIEGDEGVADQGRANAGDLVARERVTQTRTRTRTREVRSATA